MEEFTWSRAFAISVFMICIASIVKDVMGYLKEKEKLDDRRIYHRLGNRD